MDRRDFFLGGALSLAVPACSRTVSAGKALTPPPLGANPSWADVRAQFKLTRERVHMTGFLLASHPHQVADYLALTGDAVDNIPGVPGIGAKTAAILLGHFGTLDALLARADEVAFLRMRGAAAASQRLREHAVLARLSRSLTGIALDAPVPAGAEAYRRRAMQADALEPLLDRLRIGPLTRARIRALAQGPA
jgi:5'-3' exonuclease